MTELRPLPESVARALAAPKAHLRLEKNVGRPSVPGRPQVVFYDRVVAVAEDGTEVEISNCVTEWREISKVGEARRVEVILMGYHVTEADG